MIIENIEKKIKLSLLISTISIVSSFIFGVVIFFWSISIATSNLEKVYIVAGGGTHLAELLDKDEASIIEKKNLVKNFHSLFFTLAPDDEYINSNLSASMYFIDESGIRQKNALEDRGFYRNVVTTSSNLSIRCDSITFSEDAQKFTYYGTQWIHKINSTTKRSLVTEGKVMPNPRSINNPYGYIISNYKTISNKDIETKKNY